MNIQQAILKSRIQLGVGAVLVVGGMLFYTVAGLLFLHHTGQKMAESKLLWQLGVSLQNLVAGIYQGTSPYLDFVWRYAPRLSQEDPFSFGNLLCLGLFGIMMVGGQLIGDGRRLKGRVRRQLERIEEYEWRRARQGGSGTVVNARDVGVININQEAMPPSTEKEWWERPLGILALAIVGGYIVAVLAKLTGML